MWWNATQEEVVFIAVLLVCASLTDATTCDVKVNNVTFYESQPKCMEEARGLARYVANVLALQARPYCFPLAQKQT